MKKIIENRIEKILQNAQFLDKRAYFTIDFFGNIKRKNMNFTIPAMVFCEDENLFNETLKKEIDKTERIKKQKTERLSNLNTKKLNENFIKLVIKGELEFSKIYGKELALKDQDLFLKTLFNLSLMDNIKLNKPLMALSMKKVLENIGWIDEIGYLVISYFTKQRFDLYAFENANEKDERKEELPKKLSLVAYKKVLETYDYENSKKYNYILTEASKNINTYEETEIEKDILNFLEQI